MTDDVFERRTRRFHETLAILEGLARTPWERFEAEPEKYGSAERFLQVAVEILDDLGAHLVARSGAGPVERYRDVPAVRLKCSWSWTVSRSSLGSMLMYQSARVQSSQDMRIITLRNWFPGIRRSSSITGSFGGRSITQPDNRSGSLVDVRAEPMMVLRTRHNAGVVPTPRSHRQSRVGSGAFGGSAWPCADDRCCLRPPGWFRCARGRVRRLTGFHHGGATRSSSRLCRGLVFTNHGKVSGPRLGPGSGAAPVRRILPRAAQGVRPTTTVVVWCDGICTTTRAMHLANPSLRRLSFGSICTGQTKAGVQWS